MFEPIKVEKKIREKDIEDAVCRYARRLGFEAEKFVSPAKRSVPDRMFSGPGRKLFFIEFKAPGCKPTKKQKRDHERRREMGFEVYVIDDIDAGKALVNEWLDRAPC